MLPTFDGVQLTLANSVNNLGIILDPALLMEKQVNVVFKIQKGGGGSSLMLSDCLYCVVCLESQQEKLVLNTVNNKYNVKYK